MVVTPKINIKHPSGRPVRRNESRNTGYLRVPHDTLLTPRLRLDQNAHAIGFRAHLTREFDEDNHG
jgi:hypothetical protein